MRMAPTAPRIAAPDLAAVRRRLAALHSDLRNEGKNPLEALRELADRLSAETRDLDLFSSRAPSTYTALAFQEFISDDSRSVFGQYLTPKVVADHVAALVSPNAKSGLAIDPFMGSGILLDAVADADPDLKLFGCEINEPVSHVGRTALELAGHDVAIEVADAFALWRAGGFPTADVVVANPPFGAHASTVTRQELAGTVTARALGNGSKLPVELLALELCMDVLRPNGQLAIVLPQSVLTNNGWSKFRAEFFSRHSLLHVTSLPESTFIPFKGVAKACVLVIEKSTPSDGFAFTFGSSKCIGYDDTGRPQGTSDLELIASSFKAGTGRRGWFHNGDMCLAPDGSDPTQRPIRLGDVARIWRGKNAPRDVYSEEGAFHLKVGSLAGSFISWQDRKRSRVPLPWFERNADKHLRRGDICFTGTAHRPTYIGLKVDMVSSVPPEGAMPSGEVVCIRLNEDAPFPPEALLYYLRSKDGYDQVQAAVRGSTAHVYPKDLVNLRVPDLASTVDVEQLVSLHDKASAAFESYLALEAAAIRHFGVSAVEIEA